MRLVLRLARRGCGATSPSPMVAAVVAIQKELGLPIKFIGLGEQPDDLQPFDAKQFANALFAES
jgi:signal recognition particle GTPase